MGYQLLFPFSLLKEYYFIFYYWTFSFRKDIRKMWRVNRYHFDSSSLLTLSFRNGCKYLCQNSIWINWIKIQNRFNLCWMTHSMKGYEKVNCYCVNVGFTTWSSVVFKNIISCWKMPSNDTFLAWSRLSFLILSSFVLVVSEAGNLYVLYVCLFFFLILLSHF